MKKYLNTNSILSFAAGISAIWGSIFGIIQLITEGAMTFLLWIVMLIFILLGIYFIFVGIMIGKNQDIKRLRLTKEEKEYKK